MKFSVITPEHSKENIPFLIELYESILNQSYTNWEWILLVNGNLDINDIPIEIKSDDRVKIHHLTDNNTNIGYIKNVAFNLGSGDVLVEADHDDILTEDCLQELYDVYQNEEIGFVYSDTAILHMEDKFIPYNEAYGWTYKTFNWKGKELYSMNSFEPSSHSLSYIWYSPDHVRSWRASIYKELGGHNPELSICDDHELCIRTYLHTKMYRIPKVLYIYRVTGNNTWLERNEAIQSKTVELFNQYAVALAEKDAKDKGLSLVDLGGGLFGKEGYLTIDQEGADINCDLNDGIPLEDNSVGVINASHIIEHLRDPIKIMREIHRVLVHGGWAFIEVPSTDGRGAWQDPTHVSYWNENSFLYYTDKNLAQYIRNKDIKFQSFRCETWFPNEWLRGINVCVVSAWLVCNKDEKRLPHTLNI